MVDATSADDGYMELALAQAREAFNRGEVPVGAVLVSDTGKVLAAAHNCPVASNDPTAHAEIVAMRRATSVTGNYRLATTTLYVTLEPCPMCLGAILQARVARLVFGAYDPKSGAAGSVVDLTNVPSFNHHLEVKGGVRREECGELLKTFFRMRR